MEAFSLSVDERDKRITDNIGLVHSIANRFRGRGVDYEDLFQTGCIGLIKAVDGFDESRGFAFSTYAVPVIMGEVKRIFRDGGAIKVSRSLKERALKAQALRDKFISDELREPTITELSLMLSCSPEETAEILNVISPVLSLNSFGEDGDDTIDVPIDESEKIFDRLIVDRIFKQLDAKDRRLIDLRYYKGLTQAKTAEILGISQVQVSRKEKAILTRIRSTL